MSETVLWSDLRSNVEKLRYAAGCLDYLGELSAAEWMEEYANRLERDQKKEKQRKEEEKFIEENILEILNNNEELRIKEIQEFLEKRNIYLNFQQTRNSLIILSRKKKVIKIQYKNFVKYKKGV